MTKGSTRYVMLSECLPDIGCTATWDNGTRTATIFHNGKEIAKVAQNSDTAVINGKPFKLGDTAENREERLWVPIDFFTSGLGVKMNALPGGGVNILSDTINIAGMTASTTATKPSPSTGTSTSARNVTTTSGAPTTTTTTRSTPTTTTTTTTSRTPTTTTTSRGRSGGSTTTTTTSSSSSKTITTHVSSSSSRS